MSDRLREIARRTVAIAETGEYRDSAGDVVTIAAAVRAAVAGSRLYPPDEAVAMTGEPAAAPVVEVTRETTLMTRTAGSDLFVNPLMGMYFGVDLPALAASVGYLDRLADTTTMVGVALAIESYRNSITERAPRAFPH